MVIRNIICKCFTDLQSGNFFIDEYTLKPKILTELTLLTR